MNNEINYVNYVIGLFFLLFINIGPFLYYKYHKKKNFNSTGTLGIKQAI